jgi:hypothetical protein
MKVELTQQQLSTIVMALDRHSENLLTLAKQVAQVNHPNETIRQEYTEIGNLIAHLNDARTSGLV